jgi:aryl-alcohol dehydrogenase-like predicted oxidoreductase
LIGKYQQGIPKGSRLSLESYDWLRKDFESEEGKPKLVKVKLLQNIANDLNCSLAQLALAWCLKNPDVSSVITGASRCEQVIENMQSLELTQMIDADVMEHIDSILQNKPEPESDYR